MVLLLALFFLITAALYASVGFGGGSTYNALLVLSGIDYRVLPTIALLCNIIVVTGGVVAFARAGHLHARALSPFLLPRCRLLGLVVGWPFLKPYLSASSD